MYLSLYGRLLTEKFDHEKWDQCCGYLGWATEAFAVGEIWTSKLDIVWKEDRQLWVDAQKFRMQIGQCPWKALLISSLMEMGMLVQLGLGTTSTVPCKLGCILLWPATRQVSHLNLLWEVGRPLKGIMRPGPFLFLLQCWPLEKQAVSHLVIEKEIAHSVNGNS